MGEEVEIRPGIVSKGQNGETKITPILTKICSLQAEKNNLIYAVPGGLIGVGLKIDPFLTRGDRLVGRVRNFKDLINFYKLIFLFSLKDFGTSWKTSRNFCKN